MQETHRSLQQQLDELAALHEAVSLNPPEVEPYLELPRKHVIQAADTEDVEIQWVNR